MSVLISKNPERVSTKYSSLSLSRQQIRHKLDSRHCISFISYKMYVGCSKVGCNVYVCARYCIAESTVYVCARYCIAESTVYVLTIETS